MKRTGTPALTLNFQDETIMLNEDTISALDHPGQVQIMLNEEKKMLLLRPCEMDGEQAVVLPSESVLRVEIGGRVLLKKIRRITKWNNGLPRVCIGTSYPEHRVVIFSLMDACEVDLTERKEDLNGA